jgi:ubiquinone/menaquinone biosynthesis C-methylase UbiE
MTKVSTKDVDSYYKNVYWQYRLVWQTDSNHSIHYGYYDKTHRTHNTAVINMNRILANLVNITAEDRVLDMGCGIGGSAIYLAKQIGASVVGINIHNKHIEMAKNLAEEKNLTHLVSFFERDFTKTEFPDKSFDVVWCLESTPHATDKLAVLSEAWRVLKDQGRLVVASYFRRERDLTKHQQILLRNWTDGWAMPDLVKASIFKQNLEKAKFNEITYRNITSFIRPSSRYMFLSCAKFFPTGLFLRFLTKYVGAWQKGFSDEEMKNIVGGFFQYITLRRKLWEYGVFTSKK